MNSDFSKIDSLHKFTHHAMATVFEFYIQSDDELYSEEASWAAFKEIDRLEEELSRFRPNSEISNINRLAPGEKLVITIDAFDCIKRALELRELTGNMFDITYLNSAKPAGFADLILNEDDMSITRYDEKSVIDLGGIGKGYAIDKAEEILREWEISRALIHGGFSSVKAIGAPEGLSGWPLSISNPADAPETILNFLLTGGSVSGSGIKKGEHIIDPATGAPALSKSGSWAFAKSATVSEGLSTAFMILGNSYIETFCGNNDGFYAIIIDEDYRKTKKIFTAGNPSSAGIIL